MTTPRKHWTERVVGAMQMLNAVIVVTGVLFVIWWVIRAVAIMRSSTRTDAEADSHALGLLIVMGVLILLWLATRQFFSEVEREEPEYTGAKWHTVTVVFELVDTSGAAHPQQVQHALFNLLPLPVTTPEESINLEHWWVAEDERYDDSDEESAVLVPKGWQAHVERILTDRGIRVGREI